MIIVYLDKLCTCTLLVYPVVDSGSPSSGRITLSCDIYHSGDVVEFEDSGLDGARFLRRRAVRRVLSRWVESDAFNIRGTAVDTVPEVTMRL